MLIVKGGHRRADAHHQGTRRISVVVLAMTMLLGAATLTAPDAEAAGSVDNDSGLWWPLRGSHEIGCSYESPDSFCEGYHSYPAIDIAATSADDVYPALAGQAYVYSDYGACGGPELSGTGVSYGRAVVVEHANGKKTLYAHLSSFSAVLEGSSPTSPVTVTLETPLGKAGTSGYTRESAGAPCFSHLHFEVAPSGATSWGSNGGGEDPRSLRACVGGETSYYPNSFAGQSAWQGVSRGQVVGHAGPKNCTPASTAVIIDSSGSMAGNDPDDRRLDAAEAYLTASLKDDEVGIVDFDSSSKVRTETLKVGASRPRIESAIRSIDSSGGTNLGTGLQAGCDVLVRSGGEHRAAIFLTDGQGSYGGQAECFASRGWRVYVFGLGSGVDSTMLQQIANDTGGEYKQLSEATNLVCEFQQVRAKVAGQPAQSCEPTGIILQGESIDLQAQPIDLNTLQGTFTSSWSGSDIEMTLTSPSGRIIDRHSTGDDLVVTVGSTFETFTISRPEPGDWQVRLFGADIPEGGEPFWFSTLTLTGQDLDGDGVSDDDDLYPDSDTRDLVYTKDVETTVGNQVLGSGATFNDLLTDAADAASNHGQYVSRVAALVDGWVAEGLITEADGDEIKSAAARSWRATKPLVRPGRD